MVKKNGQDKKRGVLILQRNKELNEAIEEVLSNIDESFEFKSRLKRLIENAMEESYIEDDILAVIGLMKKEA